MKRARLRVSAYRSALLWLACALSLALSACDACGKHAVALARLLERNGSDVKRDHSETRERWEPAEVGAEFVLGDGLRTAQTSTAALSLRDGSKLQVRQNTTIRFLIDGSGDREQAIDVLAGEAVVTAGTSALWLRTHVGLAMINPGSRVLLTRDGEGMSLGVEVGEAHFRDNSGNDIRLTIGERVMLAVGMAILKRSGETEPTPEVKPGGIALNVKNAGVRARERGADWHELSPGEQSVAAGTGLRLPANTEVVVSRGEDSARLLGSGEYIVGAGDNLLEAVRGDVKLTARGDDVEVRVPGGRIVVRAADGGSDAALRIADGEGTLAVTQGAARFTGPSGDRDVNAGESHHWALPAAGTPRADEEEAPDYSNLSVRAGESFVVHAPQVPVAVSFDFGSACKQKGMLELAQPKRRATGTGSANLLLPSGARSYTLRCLDAQGQPGRIVARGNVHVLADAGTRTLPLRAPNSLVEADGRGYSIYYENQLPEVRVRWPNAPVANAYKLELDGKPMSVPKPEHVFESGSLRDGVHQLTFEAASRRSRTTTIDVRFDNTAATASLSSPADRAFAAGDSVSIEGVALPAWNVSVRDGTIEKIGADRFQGRVVTSAEHPDVAVRLVHRRLGTHYYLRRASGSR